jgi:23S rRNA G2445 N2-methylase RlmL
MKYIYETSNKSYEDFASGRVLYNARGTTSFPVRLASEIFLRGKSYLQSKSQKDKYVLYDPCCGGANLLTTIGILHGNDLKQIVGSDIDCKIIDLATKSLSLINVDGLNERIEQIRKMLNDFGKETHKESIESALRLKDKIVERNSSIMFNCFQADAIKDGHEVYENCEKVDFVITDVPYGDIVKWTNDSMHENPIEKLLENILKFLYPTSIVVVVADKKQVIKCANYKRLERIKVGKRQVVFLEPNFS